MKNTIKQAKSEWDKYMKAITKGRKKPKGKLNMREYSKFMKAIHKKEIDKSTRELAKFKREAKRAYKENSKKK